MHGPLQALRVTVQSLLATVLELERELVRGVRRPNHLATKNNIEIAVGRASIIGSYSLVSAERHTVQLQAVVSKARDSALCRCT